MTGDFQKLFTRIRARSDLRHAGLLVSAQATSQITLLVSAPILARLYSPAAFGEYATLLSLSTLIASVMSLGYQAALYFPISRRLIVAIFQLCAYITLATALALSFPLLLLLSFDLFSIFSSSPLLSLILLILSSSILSFQNTFNAYQARVDQYRAIALARFNITCFSSLFQIFAVFTPLQFLGLQVGRILGQITTFFLTDAKMPKNFNVSSLLSPNAVAVRYVFKRYLDFVFHVPRLILIRGASALVPVFLLAYYDPRVAGLYFFADQLIGRPSRLLNDALSRIPLKNFAERLRDRRPVVRLGIGYTLVLAGVGAPAVLVLALSGRWVFSVFLGDDWVAAAEFATIVAIPAAIRIAFMPMSALIPALRLQRWSTIIDLFFFPRVLLIPAAASIGKDAFWAITILSAVTVAYDAITFIIAYMAGRAHDRRLLSLIKTPPTPLPGGSPQHNRLALGEVDS